MKTCVEKRLTMGAPGPEVMKQAMEEYRTYLREAGIGRADQREEIRK